MAAGPRGIQRVFKKFNKNGNLLSRYDGKVFKVHPAHLLTRLWREGMGEFLFSDPSPVPQAMGLDMGSSRPKPGTVTVGGGR